jgi:hypothetical protein
LSRFISFHLDETEALALTAVSVRDHIRLTHCSKRGLHLFQVSARHAVRQISAIEFLFHKALLMTE